MYFSSPGLWTCNAYKLNIKEQRPFHLYEVTVLSDMQEKLSWFMKNTFASRLTPQDSLWHIESSRIQDWRRVLQMRAWPCRNISIFWHNLSEEECLHCTKCFCSQWLTLHLQK